MPGCPNDIPTRSVLRLATVDPEVELAAQQLKEARIDKENALGTCYLHSCP